MDPLQTPRDPRPTNENPNFIRDYFASSRLHFIGSFRARYESMLVAVSQKLNVPPSSLLSVPPPPAKSLVIHIDMDCFFASIALKLNPSLQDKCIAVCHGGGEISSCSYEARSYGVHAGMFFRNAKKLCPQLISVPYNFDQYEEASIELYSCIFKRKGICVQACSIDEAYLQVGYVLNEDSVEEWTRQLRSDIWRATGCRASAGIGKSKLVARLATKMAKPNGQMCLLNDVVQFVDGLDVKELPGIGWRTGRKLKEMGVVKCKQLRMKGVEELRGMFGEKQGKTFFDMVRGIDERVVEPLKPRKSIGAEASWGVRFLKEEGDKVEKFVKDFAEEVEKRLKGGGAVGKKVVVKVYKRKEGSMEGYKHLGHGPCNVLSRSAKLGGSLWEVVWRLFEGIGVGNEDLRGLGVQVTELTFGGLGVDFGEGGVKSDERIDTFFSNVKRGEKETVEKNKPANSNQEEENGQSLQVSKVPVVDVEENQKNDLNQETNEDGNGKAVRSEKRERRAEPPAGASRRAETKYASDDEDRIEPGRAPSPKRPNNGSVVNTVEIPSGWDPNVFLALPEDLQGELLRENADRENVQLQQQNRTHREREAQPQATARKRKRGTNGKQIPVAQVADNKRKHTEQVTMTQFADISELRARGHDVLDANEFRQKPLRDCVKLLEDLKGGGLQRLNKRLNEGAGPAIGDFVIGGDNTLDIPSPPSLSSDSDSENDIEETVLAYGNDHDQIFCDDEDIVDNACKLEAWMLLTAEEVKSGHVELLRGRLLELVRRKKLERLSCELRLIRRYAEQIEEDGWKHAFNTLLQQVNLETQRLYGFRMMLVKMIDTEP